MCSIDPSFCSQTKIFISFNPDVLLSCCSLNEESETDNQKKCPNASLLPFQTRENLGMTLPCHFAKKPITADIRVSRPWLSALKHSRENSNTSCSLTSDPQCLSLPGCRTIPLHEMSLQQLCFPISARQQHVSPAPLLSDRG